MRNIQDDYVENLRDTFENSDYSYEGYEKAGAEIENITESYAADFKQDEFLIIETTTPNAFNVMIEFLGLENNAPETPETTVANDLKM